MPGTESFEKNLERYEQWFLDNPLGYLSEIKAIQALPPPGGDRGGRAGSGGPRPGRLRSDSRDGGSYSYFLPGLKFRTPLSTSSSPCDLTEPPKWDDHARGSKPEARFIPLRPRRSFSRF